MPRKKLFNPLDMIPSPDAIRARLSEAETLAARLRILLDLAVKVHQPPTPDETTPPAPRQEVAVA